MGSVKLADAPSAHKVLKPEVEYLDGSKQAYRLGPLPWGTDWVPSLGGSPSNPFRRSSKSGDGRQLQVSLKAKQQKVPFGVFLPPSHHHIGFIR